MARFVKHFHAVISTIMKLHVLQIKCLIVDGLQLIQHILEQLEFAIHNVREIWIYYLSLILHLLLQEQILKILKLFHHLLILLLIYGGVFKI